MRARLSAVRVGAGGGLRLGARRSSRWRCAARSRIFRRRSGSATLRARPRFRAYTDEQAWWLETTRCFARSTRTMPSARGPNGRSRFATAIAEALADARVELDEEVRYPQVRAVACRRAVDRGTRPDERCGVVRRPAVRRQRRQRGRLGETGRIQSGRRRWGCRRTRSAQPDRTGDFRRTDGTCSPNATSTGSGSGRGATPISSTDIASIISSASIACTCARSDGEARACSCLP